MTASAIAAIYDRITPPVEEALIATAKAFGRTVPAARRDPFFGLDRLGGAPLPLVERLTAGGDFRKYVFVLDAGGGFGGLARWIAATYGCRVLVLDVLPSVLRVGRHLTERTDLGARIRMVAGSFEAIPVRAATFTQIWSVEALHHAGDRRRAIAELHRVLRPGSTIALQEVVRRSETVPPIGGVWRHGTRGEYLTLLRESGFTAIDCADVTADRTEPSTIERSAHDAFLRVLAERCPDAARTWYRVERVRETIEAILRGPDYRTVQLFARRPS
jgi:ubiquinone/menaquinone biosynthesis C-methylase UbiE